MSEKEIYKKVILYGLLSSVAISLVSWLFLKDIRIPLGIMSGSVARMIGFLMIIQSSNTVLNGFSSGPGLANPGFNPAARGVALGFQEASHAIPVLGHHQRHHLARWRAVRRGGVFAERKIEHCPPVGRHRRARAGNRHPGDGRGRARQHPRGGGAGPAGAADGVEPHAPG